MSSNDSHPRTRLNNILQGIYGPSAQDHVRWEVNSQGPPNALVWYASVYIDDMNYGTASTRTRGGALDGAAEQACEHLSHERPPGSRR
ncbi:uncharacterized protein F5891DRAFT_1184016 [Suillus fuscotomentosus]|uniref:DRBM domain-containing protein n=1 Tax=Suillus fuscotomentosus TaxID=1912939 RepID=A0AAD4EGL3_9AGAM|nr:uncharacterized protein F5891DRAFT_1184016 [Suillus fuscotomentosus]KAG1904593.1 hypothetical protein F5891DRAFT_1184016 [Suillus fuscotomentosus]